MSWTHAAKKSEASWRTQVRHHCGVSSRIPVVIVPGFDPPELCLFLDDMVRRIVVGKSWTRRSVGQLCREVFHQSYSDMHTSFTAHGYVPTLRPHAGRDRFTREYNATVDELANHLELLGHRVWRGSNR